MVDPISQPKPLAQPGPGLPQGWEDAGNNLVKNTATGQMVDRNHPIYKKAAAAAPPPAPVATPGGPQLPTTGTQATTGAATVGAQPGQGQPTNVVGAFQQALLNRLAPAPVNAQNPEIAGGIAANRLAEQRGMERQRAQLAERAAAQGFSGSGGFETQLQGLQEQRAAREGQYEANAVQQLGDKQRQAQLGMLGLVGNMLSDQERLALSRELGLADVGLREQGLQQQGDLASRELGLRGELGRGQLNLGLLGALLSDRQHGQNLGLQAGIAGANLNQSALLNLLNGL